MIETTFIEKVYNGGASKNNTGFIGGEPKQILDYSNAKETENLISLLKENNFTKIHIRLHSVTNNFLKKVLRLKILRSGNPIF